MKFLSLTLLSCVFIFSSNCKKCPDPVNNEVVIDKTITDTLYLKDTINLVDTVYYDFPKQSVPKGQERFKTVGFTSAFVNTMYYNCGNIITIDIPDDWGDAFFTGSSARILPSKSDKKKISVVPTGRKTVVGVSVNHKGARRKIGDIRFNVIKPPKPTLQLLVNGKEYNGVSPISKKSRVVIRIKPDADFLANYPKDARYMISTISLYSQRSLGVPTKIGSYSGAGKDAKKGIPISLGNKLKADPPGTKIYFKIDRLYRVNFQNKKILQNFPESYLWLGAIVR